MTSVTIAERKPAPPQAADKPKPPKVQGKLRAALDKMVWEGMTYDEAARSVGFTVASMRKALQRNHVLAYVRSEREIVRASITPKNIHRLREIRDAGDNMPAVNAIKLLEQIGDEDRARGGSNAAPGFVIVINNGSADMGHIRQIEAKPLISQGRVPHDEGGTGE